MRWLTNMSEAIKSGIKTWLRIQPAQIHSISIQESLDFEGNAIKNQIWYQGDSEELSQLYKQIWGDSTRFWKAVPTIGMDIRKIHVGLPAIMVDLLSNIVIADLNEITVTQRQEDWKAIEKENDFKKLILSPSTLGIDTKKLDNAEAQREKEKVTLYTRNKIIEVLQEVIPILVTNTIKAYDTLHKNPIQELEVEVSFGEYANPSFESQVETVGKARMQGVMSVEASVDELHGSSKDETWKNIEIARLKNEQGIAEVEEPGINLDALNIRKGYRSKMQVIINNHSYLMSREKYKNLLVVAKEQVPLGIYAIEKKEYAELKTRTARVLLK